jgi:hypothetical protein
MGFSALRVFIIATAKTASKTWDESWGGENPESFFSLLRPLKEIA